MLTAETRVRDFPSLAGRVYLNTAAECVPPLSVRAALLDYFEDKTLGMDGRPRHQAQWQAAKQLTAEFYGLTADEVSLCSCSSEAYNLAAQALALRDGDEVVINDLDFPAGATPWLQQACPATTRLWRHRDGALRVADLVPLLGPRTRLVTTSLVSFFNGFVAPLAEIASAVRRHSSALLAVDVTQALGRIPLNLSLSQAAPDLIISSTHKWMLGTHGGGLVGVPARSAAAFTVPAGGWFHLHDPFGPRRFEEAISKPGAAGFTTGMPNYPAVYTARAGLEYIRSVTVEAIAAAAGPLVEQCVAEVARMPVELLTPRGETLAGIFAFRHPDVERLHQHLLRRGIHVMHQAGRLRVAIHGYNTPADIETFLRELHAGLRG